MSEGFRFGAVSTKAIRDHRVSDAELRVLAELSTYADADGWCEPKQSTMAEHLGGVTRQSISKHLRSLIELGYVLVEEQRRDDGGRRSNRYCVRMDPATPEVAGGATLEVAGAATPEVAARTDHQNRPSEQNPPAPPEQSVEQAPLIDVPKPERKKSPRELISDTLVRLFGAQTKSERRLCGIVASELVALDPSPSPEEVEARARWVLGPSGYKDPGPKALAAHWKDAGVKIHGRDDEPTDPQAGMAGRGR